MTRHDHGDHFCGLILPHGLLELTAVFVAGGIGLRLSGRGSSRATHAVPVLAARAVQRHDRARPVVVLFVSGVIEAFVTPSGLPPRRGSGSASPLSWASSPTSSRSAAAYRRGDTGDVDAAMLEDKVATAS